VQVKFNLKKNIAFRRDHWVLWKGSNESKLGPLKGPVRPNDLGIISNLVSEHRLTVVRTVSTSERKHENNVEPWTPLCHVIFWKHSVTGEVSRARGRGGGFNGTRNYTNRIYPVNLLTASQRRWHPAYNEPWNLPEIADCVFTGTAYGCNAKTGKLLRLQVTHTSSTISLH